jgi:hypothetical protein
MINLFDKESNAFLGSVTEEQFKLMTDLLEEESTDDKDYYLDQATIDLLEENGADAALVTLLRNVLGPREGVEVRWSRS